MTSAMRLPIAVTVTDESGPLQPITNTAAVQDGVELRLTSWSGWTDTPDIRAAPEDLPGGDGSYDSAPLFGSRLVVLKGVALADSARDLVAAERRFKRTLTRGSRYGTVRIDQGEDDWVESLQAEVRLNGASTWSVTHPFRAEWTMALFAADPRRYGVTPNVSAPTPRYQPSSGRTYPRTFPVSYGGVGTGGTIVAVNDGDVPTGVLLEVAGACSNPQIVLRETGQRIALQTTFGDGVKIDTNTRVRSVKRNGAPFGGALTSDSDLFELQPGASTLLFLAESGNPTLTATWSDATL